MATMIRMIGTLYVLVSLGVSAACAEPRSVSRVSDLEQRLEGLISLNEQLALSLEQRDKDLQADREKIRRQIAEIRQQLNSPANERRQSDRAESHWRQELHAVQSNYDARIADLENQLIILRADARTQEHRHLMELVRLRAAQPNSARQIPKEAIPEPLDLPRYTTAIDRVSSARGAVLGLRSPSVPRTTAIYRAQR